MNFLDPIFDNNTGTIYALRSNLSMDEPINRVQLQIGDVAILMYKEEVDAFLKTIKQAKISEGCNCENCSKGQPYKIIKCNTAMANIKFKMTPSNLNDLEELVMSLFFHEKINSILENNDIDNLSINH